MTPPPLPRSVIPYSISNHLSHVAEGADIEPARTGTESAAQGHLAEAKREHLVDAHVGVAGARALEALVGLVRVHNDQAGEPSGQIR
jgi:hypothetical protein